MVKESMDLLELLRKRGVDGDVDFLREALRVLMDAIMDAEVSARIGAEHGERSPGDLPVTTIEFAGCSRAISSTRRWNIAHRSTGSIDEAEADERQDTAGRSGGIGHEREVGAELE